MGVAASRFSDGTATFRTTDEPPIHWPSAIVGLILATALVVGVSWFASVRRPEARVTAPAVQTIAQPIETVVPTPIPPPASTPPPTVERIRVANTNGLGVNLRAAAGERSARIKTVAEGTPLDLVGPDQTANGITWRNVRDPGGAIGWVAATFVTPGGQ